MWPAPEARSRDGGHKVWSEDSEFRGCSKSGQEEATKGRSESGPWGKEDEVDWIWWVRSVPGPSLTRSFVHSCILCMCCGELSSLPPVGCACCVGAVVLGKLLVCWSGWWLGGRVFVLSGRLVWAADGFSLSRSLSPPSSLSFSPPSRSHFSLSLSLEYSSSSSSFVVAVIPFPRDHYTHSLVLQLFTESPITIIINHIINHSLLLI